MKKRSLLLLLVSISFGAMTYPYPVAANPACGATIPSGVTTLTGPMSCSATGIVMASNSTLDCAGFPLTGQDSPLCNPDTTCKTNHFGIRSPVSNPTRLNVTVKNCTVSGFERGIYFSSTRNAVVQDSTFRTNTRYGGDFADTGVSITRAAFVGNGDEGVHITGNPVSAGVVTIKGSRAIGNVLEGFYVLDAPRVTLGGPVHATDMNYTEGNGSAGVYLKNSPAHVEHLQIIDDDLQLTQGTTGASVSRVRIAGGRVKVDTSSPANTFDHVCVIGRGGKPASEAFLFDASPNQTVTNSVTSGLAPGVKTVSIVGNTGAGTSIALWVPTGDTHAHATGAATYVATSGLKPSCVGTVHSDFDGDGKSDILWTDISGNVAMWLMNGTSVLTNVYVSSVSSGWTQAGVGDFNGDGKADILWRNTSSGDLALWLMDGTDILSNNSLGNVPTSWTPALVRDFDGDGRADILWRDTSGNLSMWLMNGPTIVSNTFLGNVPTSWTPR